MTARVPSFGAEFDFNLKISTVSFSPELTEESGYKDSGYENAEFLNVICKHKDIPFG